MNPRFIAYVLLLAPFFSSWIRGQGKIQRNKEVDPKRESGRTNEEAEDVKPPAFSHPQVRSSAFAEHETSRHPKEGWDRLNTCIQFGTLAVSALTLYLLWRTVVAAEHQWEEMNNQTKIAYGQWVQSRDANNLTRESVSLARRLASQSKKARCEIGAPQSDLKAWRITVQCTNSETDTAVLGGEFTVGVFAYPSERLIAKSKTVRLLTGAVKAGSSSPTTHFRVDDLSTREFVEGRQYVTVDGYFVFDDGWGAPTPPNRFCFAIFPSETSLRSREFSADVETDCANAGDIMKNKIENARRTQR